jgi:hypothetical protein
MARATFAGSLASGVLLGLLSACDVEVTQHPTDLTVRVGVTQQSKREVVGVLDRVTSAKGWVRTPAAPGLNELHKREVLFFSYGRHSQDMLITIHDLKDVSELELSAFFEASAPGLVEGVAARFVAEVKTLPGVTSVREERRAQQ